MTELGSTWKPHWKVKSGFSHDNNPPLLDIPPLAGKSWIWQIWQSLYLYSKLPEIKFINNLQYQTLTYTNWNLTLLFVFICFSFPNSGMLTPFLNGKVGASLLTGTLFTSRNRSLISKNFSRSFRFFNMQPFFTLSKNISISNKLEKQNLMYHGFMV